MFFNVVQDLLKWFEVLCRSVIIPVGSNAERIFNLSGLRKSTQYVVKFCAQKINYMHFQENVFHCSKGLIQMIRGSM